VFSWRERALVVSIDKNKCENSFRGRPIRAEEDSLDSWRSSYDVFLVFPERVVTVTLIVINWLIIYDRFFRFFVKWLDKIKSQVGPKDSPTIFWRELHNLQADDASDVGYAITTAFDILNMERFDHGRKSCSLPWFQFWFSELDSIGRGRQPWSIRPSAVIVLSDGGMLTNKSLTRSDLELPGSSLPGSALITEPFRWDQRVYSLCLRLDGHGSGDQVDRSDERVVHGSDPLAALCEVTGGKSYQGRLTKPPRHHFMSNVYPFICNYIITIFINN
jgi:hypothetical protein